MGHIPYSSSSHSRRRRARGQVLIIFAAALVALVGMLGLATDLGFSFAERRTMQNAADAGALAGTRIISKADPLHPTSAWSEVQTMVNKNKIGSTNPTITSCEYVSDPDGSGNEQDLGSCTMTVPMLLGPAATGVRVTVKETHDTFFMQAVPGAPDQVSTGATATAHVMIPQFPSNGPFLVCGISTIMSDATGKPIGPLSIVTKNVSGQWVVNPALISMIEATPSLNPWFVIHDSQANNPSKFADCGVPNAAFKGVADTVYNTGKSLPGYLQYTTGKVASIQTTVDGIGGCQSNQSITNCIAVLPIAINQTSPDGTPKLWSVMLVPFYIVSIQNNNNTAQQHLGKIVPAFIIYGQNLGSTYGWNPNYYGPVVIRMTN